MDVPLSAHCFNQGHNALIPDSTISTKPDLRQREAPENSPRPFRRASLRRPTNECCQERTKHRGRGTLHTFKTSRVMNKAFKVRPVDEKKSNQFPEDTETLLVRFVQHLFHKDFICGASLTLMCSKTLMSVMNK